MNFLQKLDIITLSDNKVYTVVETCEEKNISYLMLVENKSDDSLSDNVRYAKVIVLPTRKYGIETIESLEERKHLSEIFMPMFKEDY